MTCEIEPSLFDLLDEYSAEIANGATKPGSAVRRSSKVIAFMQSFFEQLFASCFSIQLRAFDDASKRMSVAMRHQQEVADQLRPVVSAFEEACDLYPDIIGASYGGGSILMFQRFHKRFLPRLLRSAERWADETDQPELAARIRSSSNLLLDALTKAQW